MVDRRRYKRYFIILENEDRGFENSPKKVPKGYAKIEIRNGKGLLNVYVQDLKYFEEPTYIYRNYLISTKDNRNACIDTGTFVIDRHGRGELTVKIDPDNVEGSGKTIEDFNVIAVAAEALNKSQRDKEIYGPLVGYIDKKKVDWKSAFIREEATIETQEVFDEELEGKNKNKELMDEYREEYGEMEDEQLSQSEDKDIEFIRIEKEYTYEEKKEEEKEEEKVEEKEDKEPECIIYEKEEKEEECEMEEEKKEEEYKVEKKEKEEYYKEQYNHKKHYQYKGPVDYYKKYCKTVYKRIRDILKGHERYEPFERDMEGCRWWRLEYNRKNMCRNYLPYFGYLLSTYYYNPYVYHMNNSDELMHKYGHYIFGISYDKDEEPNYYIYGIPGRYLYNEQPFRGMTGFVYWNPIEDKKPQRGDYGYWICYIDAETGNVVYPFKPTMPPMY